MEPINIAIIYYSVTGTVRFLAEAAADGAASAGATVRIRSVAESGDAAAPGGGAAPTQREEEAGKGSVPASHDDLRWADAVIFGTPTRFGNPATPIRAFIDSTGPLWREGVLADKVYSAFTSSSTLHGGQESTLLALGHTFTHWGGISVPPGYTDPVHFRSGNPYGASAVARDDASLAIGMAAARAQAQRVAVTALALKTGRAVISARATAEFENARR